MTKLLFFLLLMSIQAGSLMAQKLFTLEELNFGGKNASKFYPERWQLRWDGDRLIDAADKTKPLVIDRKTGKTIEAKRLTSTLTSVRSTKENWNTARFPALLPS